MRASKEIMRYCLILGRGGNPTRTKEGLKCRIPVIRVSMRRKSVLYHVLGAIWGNALSLERSVSVGEVYTSGILNLLHWPKNSYPDHRKLIRTLYYNCLVRN
jgi:hypothetical protein